MNKLLEEETSQPEKAVTREMVLQFLACSDEGIKLSDGEKERFVRTAVSCQLNPFKRDIHLRIGHEAGKQKVQIITGYEVYLRKAEQTGLLDGWKAWTEGSGEGLRAIVEIRRKDWGNPFIHEVYWNEAAPKVENVNTTTFWEKMPRFQLKKVAISQGFRLCFANEIGGMPYEGAELPESNLAGQPYIADHPKEKQTEDGQGSSVNGLVNTIHKLAMEQQAILSPSHLEWIENQLRQEKSEAQLRGLLKHVQESISSGGDQNDQPKQKAARPTYPRNNKGIKPRLPVNNARPTIPQGYQSSKEYVR